MTWDRHTWDRELGRRDRAEIEPVPRKRPKRRHAVGCFDDEGKLECVCAGSVQFADHPDFEPGGHR